MKRTTISRRRFVLGATATAATLAGCSGSETADDENSGDTSDSGSTDAQGTTEEPVGDEQTFDGETVDVLGFPDTPASNYPPAYILYLPYGTGDSREYYRTSIVTYSDIYGLGDEERDTCNELIRTATETVRSSLRPNPETTVDDA